MRQGGFETRPYMRCLLDFRAGTPYISIAKSPPSSELPPYGVRARFRRE
jgi:hypothetical protein